PHKEHPNLKPVIETLTPDTTGQQYPVPLGTIRNPTVYITGHRTSCRNLSRTSRPYVYAVPDLVIQSCGDGPVPLIEQRFRSSHTNQCNHLRPLEQ
ncbi:Hypothetical predicted protein, partial [Pelobates cultripes]